MSRSGKIYCSEKLRDKIEIDESIKRWSKIIKSRNNFSDHLLKTYYYYDGDINKKYDTYMDKMPYVIKEALCNIVYAKINKIEDYNVLEKKLIYQ